MRPSSLVHGTWGRNFERSTSVTARPRTSPDRTRLKTPPTLSKATSTWPPSTPVSCCAPPSKWTMRNSHLAASCTIRMARWSSLRMPVVQALILPGFFFAASMRSASVL